MVVGEEVKGLEAADGVIPLLGFGNVEREFGVGDDLLNVLVNKVRAGKEPVVARFREEGKFRAILFGEGDSLW